MSLLRKIGCAGHQTRIDEMKIAHTEGLVRKPVGNKLGKRLS